MEERTNRPAPGGATARLRAILGAGLGQDPPLPRLPRTDMAAQQPVAVGGVPPDRDDEEAAHGEGPTVKRGGDPRPWQLS